MWISSSWHRASSSVGVSSTWSWVYREVMRTAGRICKFYIYFIYVYMGGERERESKFHPITDHEGPEVE